MRAIEVVTESAAPPEQVWALLADVRTWSRWASFDEASVESGSGIGEVRVLRAGRTVLRERVTVLEPPYRFGYEIVSGLPGRGHEAEVLLTTTPSGGTRIEWSASVEAATSLSLAAVRRRLEESIVDTAERLAHAAVARAS